MLSFKVISYLAAGLLIVVSGFYMWHVQTSMPSQASEDIFVSSYENKVNNLAFIPPQERKDNKATTKNTSTQSTTSNNKLSITTTDNKQDPKTKQEFTYEPKTQENKSVKENASPESYVDSSTVGVEVVEKTPSKEPEPVKIITDQTQWTKKALGEGLFNLLFGKKARTQNTFFKLEQTYTDEQKNKIKRYANEYVSLFNKYYYIQIAHEQAASNAFGPQTKDLDFTKRMQLYTPEMLKLAKEYEKFAKEFSQLQAPDEVKNIHNAVASNLNLLKEAVEKLANSASEQELVYNIENYSNVVNNLVNQTNELSDFVKLAGIKFDPGEPGAVLLFSPQAGF